MNYEVKTVISVFYSPKISLKSIDLRVQARNWRILYEPVSPGAYCTKLVI
jgi:hypothetical protein